MKNKLRFILLSLLFVALSCTNSNLPNFEVIERDVYDAPIKSQILLRVEITDTIVTDAQLAELMTKLSGWEMEKKMKFHLVPTHVFIYAFKDKATYEKDASDYLASFEKMGENDPGKFNYKNTLSPKNN